MPLNKIIKRPDPICAFEDCIFETEQNRVSPFQEFRFDSEANAYVFTIDTSFYRKSDPFRFGCQLRDRDDYVYTNYLHYDVQLDCSQDRYYIPTAPDSVNFYWLYSGDDNYTYTDEVDIQSLIIHPEVCTSSFKDCRFLYDNDDDNYTEVDYITLSSYSNGVYEFNIDTSLLKRQLPVKLGCLHENNKTYYSLAQPQRYVKANCSDPDIYFPIRNVSDIEFVLNQGTDNMTSIAVDPDFYIKRAETCKYSYCEWYLVDWASDNQSTNA